MTGTAVRPDGGTLAVRDAEFRGTGTSSGCRIHCRSWRATPDTSNGPRGSWSSPASGWECTREQEAAISHHADTEGPEVEGATVLAFMRSQGVPLRSTPGYVAFCRDVALAHGMTP